MATYLFSVNFGSSKSGLASSVRYSVRDSSPATRIAATNTGIAEKLDAAGTTGTGSYSAIVSVDDSGWTFPVEVLYSIVGQTGVGVVDTIYYSPSLIANIWAVALSDISSIPAITASVKDAINWLFVLGRNKRTQTATTETVFKDDGTTTAATSTKSDDGSVFTRGKYS